MITVSGWLFLGLAVGIAGQGFNVGVHFALGHWTKLSIFLPVVGCSLLTAWFVGTLASQVDGTAGTVYDTTETRSCHRVLFVDSKGRKGDACVPNDQRSRYPVGSQYPQGAPW